MKKDIAGLALNALRVMADKSLPPSVMRQMAIDTLRKAGVTSKRIAFKVVIDLPPDASIQVAKEYIADSIHSWRGQLKPPDDEDDGDPMHSLDTRSIAVTFIGSEPKKAKPRKDR
jgi:hypothetical protein